MKIKDVAILIERLLDKTGQAFCDGYLSKNEKIERFYEATRHYDDFIAREHIVTKYTCNHPGIYADGVTRKELDEFIEKALSWEPSVDDIRVHYEYFSTYKDGSRSRVSGAYSLDKFDKEQFALNEDDLSEELERLRDTYLPKEGHINCSYCGKAVPENEAVDYTIIYQGWNGYKKTVMRKTNKYCPGNCGVHDQMAHEG